MERDEKRQERTLRELLSYMRTLRRRGADNYLLGRLAPGERAEGVVEFILERGYGQTLKERVDTIVVSDLHLGSKHSRAEMLRDLLARFEFNRLVLNGDIFDHLDAPQLKEGHAQLLEKLNELSRTHEVVWIEGNHDAGLDRFLGARGVTVRREYMWDYDGKRYLAIHGDQFDYFATQHPVLYAIGTRFFAFVQWMGPWTKSFCRFLKRETKWYTDAISSSVQAALAYARSRDADVVVCGHTHHPRQLTVGGVGYYNPGGWTEHTYHLVTIGERGVRIHAFGEKGEHLGIAVAA